MFIEMKHPKRLKQTPNTNWPILGRGRLW